MGKEKMKYIWLLVFLSVYFNSYAQEGDTKNIEWKKLEEKDKVIYEDTCSIMTDFERIWGKAPLTNVPLVEYDGKCYYCRSASIGSGMPIISVMVFKQEGDSWKLIADGRVVSREIYSISPMVDVSNRKIEFWASLIKYDSVTHKTRIIKNAEKIGELSLEYM
ncbi:MAG: hypothetical protein IKQ72_11405 [Bacteroidaceae bacterium]|nr:hypothetical protein [Bacteroidaceae bacterium]